MDGVTLTQELPAAPRPRTDAGATTRAWSVDELDAEARRLAAAIGQPDRWGLEMCHLIAPLTLEINALKAETDTVILAHSYQTPDIVYGVADRVGDSYGLSKDAMEADQSRILFSSVRFMAETAKLLNPEKDVLLPSPDAGCSLADGITAADVRALKARYPGVPVLCYINTTAAVKAECDATCTSSNYVDVARNLPGDELVFVPDRFMGRHLQTALAGEKTVHVYEDAECEVHVQFTAESAQAWREAVAADGRRLEILAHPECDPRVLLEADYIGSTEKMMDYARRLEAEGKVDVLPITECGTSDRLRAELPGLRVHGTCVQCPHMKKTGLVEILNVLRAPTPEQLVTIPDDEAAAARACIDAMFQYGG
ncbi:MAG: quinolinate synthase NadA [Thermoplasmatota archaeon]